jgi:site-specific DNA recombinase
MSSVSETPGLSFAHMGGLDNGGWREMNAGRAEEIAARARLEAEHAQVTRRLDGLYEAIADGLRTAGLKPKLEVIEVRLAAIDAKLSAPAPSSVRLLP